MAVIRLLLLPLQSVTSITVTDSDGVTSEVDSATYQVRSGEAPRIVLAPGKAWPAMRPYDAMTITAVVGYGDAGSNLPEEVLMLLKGLVQHQYRSKGMGVAETVSGQLIGVPMMFERMIFGAQG